MRLWKSIACLFGAPRTLFNVYEAARLVGAENVDKGKLTEAEYNLQLAELRSRFTAEAQRRGLAVANLQASQAQAQAANTQATAAMLQGLSAFQMANRPPPTYNVDGIHRMDVGRIFLNDPLQHALGSGALDPCGDTRVVRLEGLTQGFRHLEIRGRVEDNLAFLLGRPNELGRYRRELRRRGTGGKNESHAEGDKREAAPGAPTRQRRSIPGHCVSQSAKACLQLSRMIAATVEEVLDEIALAIEHEITFALELAIGLWRDHWNDCPPN
jgi:hypothetical protein